MARYGEKASAKVETAMRELHEGTLRSGRSGKKVTNPRQAIAIGLSEARKEGAKVPARKAATKSSRSAAAPATAGRRTSASTGKSASSPAKRASPRGTAARKSSAKSAGVR